MQEVSSLPTIIVVVVVLVKVRVRITIGLRCRLTPKPSSSTGYNYADIITIHPDHLPEFEKKIAAFFDEHIHDAEEIRYILGGSGYFDVRDLNDNWVRIHVKKGDLMTLPEGIYHRFTCDEKRFIHAMRLFKGQPVWTPFSRPQEDHPSRKAYVATFMEEKKE